MSVDEALELDDELSFEFKLAVRELNVELRAARDEVAELRVEIQQLRDGLPATRLDRIEQVLAVELGHVR